MALGRAKAMVFTIEVDSKSGEAKLRSFESTAKGSYDKVSQGAEQASSATSSLTGMLGKLGLAAGATAAAMAALNFGRQAVQTYARYELAEKRRASALRRTGQLTEENVRRMDELVNALTFGSNATKEQIENYTALALSMGATIDQSSDLVRAALDMASAIGVDKDQAIRQVMRTLGGYAGELAEVVPEVKNLTREQLMAGEAADILAQKFGGAALDEVDSLAGASNNLNTALEQATATTGKIIAEFFGLQAAAEKATEGITSLNEKLTILANLTSEENAAIIRVDDQLRSMADAAGLNRYAFSAIVEEMNRAKKAGAGIGDIQELLDEVKASGASAKNEIYLFRTGITELADEMETAAENQRLLKYHTDEYAAAVARKREAAEKLTAVLKEQKRIEKEMAEFQKGFNEQNADMFNPQPDIEQDPGASGALGLLASLFDEDDQQMLEQFDEMSDKFVEANDNAENLAASIGMTVENMWAMSDAVNFLAAGFTNMAAAYIASALAGDKANISLHNVLKTMSQQAIATALFELAAGLAATTPWGRAIYGDPAPHFAAAKWFGAAGVALGVAANAAGGGGGGGSSSSGIGDNTRNFDQEAPAQQGQQITVVLENTAVVGMTSEEMAENIQEAIERANERTGRS